MSSISTELLSSNVLNLCVNEQIDISKTVTINNNELKYNRVARISKNELEYNIVQSDIYKKMILYIHLDSKAIEIFLVKKDGDVDIVIDGKYNDINKRINKTKDIMSEIFGGNK